MVKYLVTIGLFWLTVFTTLASPADSSYTVSSASDNYRCVFNKEMKRNEIKNISVSHYIANNYQVNIPVFEMYNDHVTIDKVDAEAEGKTPRGFKPQYEYYSVNNIFYSDARICYFPLPISKKGGMAEVSFAKTIDDPRYFTSIYFSEPVEVTEKMVSLKIPRWMKVEIKEFNFGTHNIKKTVSYDSQEDADIITYTAKYLPAMVQEDNSPGPTHIYPHLLVLSKSGTVNGKTFTYLNNLDDQYKWYRELVSGIEKDQSAAAVKAKEITAGITNDIDKIKAIFYYVQDNIRYIAFEDGIGGFKPDKADEVLRKKYGDCKGMANLTKAMLTALDFDARLCWIGTNHIAYNYQTPTVAVDNHMICGLLYKGKTYYLDATQTYLGFDEYAERIQGRQVLMEDGEKHILNTIPVALPAQNTEQETSKLTMQGTSLTGTVKRVWKGEEKEDVLYGFNSVKKDEAQESMVKFLTGDNSSHVITELVVSGTTDPDKDFTAAYNIERKKAVSSFGSDHYVDLDAKKEFINSAITIAERKHDYWFSHKMNINKEAELAIPANYKVSGLPAELNISNPDYEFHIKYISQPGKLIYKKTILVKNTRLPVSKFQQWNNDIEQLAKAYNESVILKPVSQ